MTATVKTRRYDATRRQDQAKQRQRAILDAAQALFFEHGYAATTVAGIAAAASVSPETVYKTFGGKAGLVRALRDRALLGVGSVPAERRSDDLRDLSDPREVVRGWARLATEVAPRVVPLLLLVRDASIVDATIRELSDELDAERRRRMRANAQALARAGHLRAGISLTSATDVMFAVSSPEMYDLLVVRGSWSLRRYASFVESTITNALL
ncbi:TetR/AcrR family transcriptional regulator [Cellulomonas sp. McL0617]|uniref:TetR/AcrR family transcriptional regulator n=1 Tax=Cellulomonas sp. McL0617 TaxID=3415675 RepID=UPI003CFA2504